MTAVANPASLQQARDVMVQDEVVVNILVERLVENQIRVCKPSSMSALSTKQVRKRYVLRIQ